jgi:nicotinate-nucleotide pyrophosphorylase (carboxylating)
MSLEKLIEMALAEDSGGAGDVTTLATVEAAARGEARVLAKQDLVLSGSAIIAATFPRAEITLHAKDGDALAKGTVVATLRDSLRTLLTGERVMLNLLMHCCGVATLTRQAQQALQGSATRLLDTRKTTPGLRFLEKQAVRDGGGHNHRFGLSDGILIKDNHIAAAGSITLAVQRARAAAHHLLKIECEVSTLAQIDEALTAGADILLLDNTDNEALAAAVKHIAGRARTEASGNMTIARLPAVAQAGVDFVSMGALTHSAPAADLSMKIDARR